MKKRIYFQGQQHFGNRGCEALVRSTVALLQDEFKEVEVLVPSIDKAHDLKQWPDAMNNGVRFTNTGEKSVPSLRWWKRIVRRAPFLLKEKWLPKLAILEDVNEDIRSSDAVLIIGGDTITLDNGIVFLIKQVQTAEIAIKAGVPVVLWAASIGPFTQNKYIEEYITKFLSKLSMITVRETISLEYLKSIGISDHVSLVADPAFIMEPQAIDMNGLWVEKSPNGVLGFNISPLIKKYRPCDEDESVLISEVTNFLEDVLKEKEMSVVLIPHVEPLRKMQNSDRLYMEKIINNLTSYGEKIKLIPDGYNAAQLKYLISKCRFFIGARMHSTIAALSTYVPTISIAYSIKAKGVNNDLFGHTKYVLETPAVSRASLNAMMDCVFTHENQIRAHLEVFIPRWKDRTKDSVKALSDIIAN